MSNLKLKCDTTNIAWYVMEIKYRKTCLYEFISISGYQNNLISKVRQIDYYPLLYWQYSPSIMSPSSPTTNDDNVAVGPGPGNRTVTVHWVGNFSVGIRNNCIILFRSWFFKGNSIHRNAVLVIWIYWFLICNMFKGIPQDKFPLMMSSSRKKILAFTLIVNKFTNSMLLGYNSKDPVPGWERCHPAGVHSPPCESTSTLSSLPFKLLLLCPPAAISFPPCLVRVCRYLPTWTQV